MKIECEIYGLRPPSAPVLTEMPNRAERQHACAQCRSASVLRDLRRRGIERWLLALVGHRPYRCLDCGHRFFDRPLASRVGRAITGAPRPWPSINR